MPMLKLCAIALAPVADSVRCTAGRSRRVAGWRDGLKCRGMDAYCAWRAEPGVRRAPTL